MKVLQKTKIVVSAGKELERTAGKGRKVIDSVAEGLILDGEAAIKGIKNIKGIETLTVWIEVEQEDAFDVKTANKAALLAYAEENEIDLGEAKTNDQIRAVIVASEEE